MQQPNILHNEWEILSPNRATPWSLIFFSEFINMISTRFRNCERSEAITRTLRLLHFVLLSMTYCRWLGGYNMSDFKVCNVCQYPGTFENAILISQSIQIKKTYKKVWFYYLFWCYRTYWWTKWFFYWYC